MAELTPDICALFSKSGFSNKLKNEKGADLKLFALKNYRSLIEDLSEEELLVNSGKKY